MLRGAIISIAVIAALLGWLRHESYALHAVRLNKTHFTWQREAHTGIPHLVCDRHEDCASGLGFMHATDRSLGMQLVRIVAQGRVSELLKENRPLDVLMRSMGFDEVARRDFQALDVEDKRLLEAYAEGVNAALRRPFEFVLSGTPCEPWEPYHTLLVVKLLGWVDLQDGQQTLERLIIEVLQAEASSPGLPAARTLRVLLAPLLDDTEDDAELRDALRKLRVQHRVIKDELIAALPKLQASNNFVLSPKLTKSGATIAAFDPHLPANRLPPFWYEVTMNVAGRAFSGVSLPGLHALVFGRTKEISLGLTYGMLDSADFSIERVQNSSVLTPRGTYEPLVVRSETLMGQQVFFFRTRGGAVLECPSESADLADGMYVARHWTSDDPVAITATVRALRLIQNARTVIEAQRILREVDLPANWLIADSAGNIGYQQSGRAPVRAHSGLHPVLGWRTDVWSARVPAEELKTVLNPPEGFLVTANDEQNPEGRRIVNIHMESRGLDGRGQRIRQLISAGGSKLDVLDAQRIQTDLFSHRAARLSRGRLEWDAVMDANRNMAKIALYEAYVSNLYELSFGKLIFGPQLWKQIEPLISVFLTTYFDVAFDDDALFPNRTAIMDEAWARAVKEVDVDAARAHRTLPWINVFWGSLAARVPLLHDYVFVCHGAGDTVSPSHIGLDKLTGLPRLGAASWRSVTDMSTSCSHTALPGGVSDKFYSSLYVSDLENWSNFQYKDVCLR